MAKLYNYYASDADGVNPDEPEVDEEDLEIPEDDDEDDDDDDDDEEEIVEENTTN